jgi:4-hydroxy-tetrahydrodipicolinate reductase
MRKVKVVLYGVGAVGKLIAKFLLEKENMEIVGAVDFAKDKVGKDLGAVLGIKKMFGISVSEKIENAISKKNADIAIHATSSYLKETYPQIKSLIEHDLNVVSTCEELSYPYFTSPALAKKIDTLAKQHDVTVLGTGINPGFVMDTLVIVLTAACQKIERIQAVRVMNAATRRLPFQKKIGAGLKIEEFKKGIEKKQITGHVGLTQSIAMIADAVGWVLDDIVVELVSPVIAEKPVESREIKVKAGHVAGLRQRAKGIVKGKEAIVLDFQAYIGAKEEYDAITIKGVPNIEQRIKPCIHGDIGTVAVITNIIPKVINAQPGLVTMKDLPVPAAALGDIRNYFSPKAFDT